MGQVAVVTGSSRGIGAAIARLFAVQQDKPCTAEPFADVCVGHYLQPLHLWRFRVLQFLQLLLLLWLTLREQLLMSLLLLLPLLWLQL